MSSTKVTSAAPAAATTAKTAAVSGWALPIALFSIPLGLAGLGGPVHPPLSSRNSELAWLAITHGQIDQLQAAVGGVTLFTLLIQLFFVSTSGSAGLPASASTAGSPSPV